MPTDETDGAITGYSGSVLRGEIMYIPQIGDKIPFLPAAFAETRQELGDGKTKIPGKVVGEVVFVNEKHGFYDVQYEVNGYRLRESLKIGGEWEK